MESSRALANWQTPECPFTIEYSTRVLEDIRLEVTDAFFSLPRGGVEIGGLLTGRFKGDAVIIEGHVPVECEHAFGPSYTLSPNDHARLDQAIEKYAVDDGPTVVGWYHSHTRSEIFFSAADIEVHRRFFPEPRQVGLVIRPRTLGPAGAGFFFREPDGSIRGEACYAEFSIDALPVRPASKPAPPPEPPRPAPIEPPRAKTPPPYEIPPPPPPPPPPEVVARPPIPVPIPIDISAPRPRPVLADALDAAPAPIEIPHPKLEEPPPLIVTPLPPIEAPHDITPHQVAAPIAEHVPEPEPESGLEPEPHLDEPIEVHAEVVHGPVDLPAPRFHVAPERSRAWTVAAVALAGGALVGAAFQTRGQWLPPVRSLTAKLPTSSTSPPPSESVAPAPTVTAASSVNFRTFDAGGQLQLRWDRDSPFIRGSSGALLMITDGGAAPQAIGLDRAHVQAGSFTYARQSGQVDVSLTVHLPNGQDLKELATFLGQAPAGQKTEPAPKLPKGSKAQKPAVRARTQEDGAPAPDAKKDQQRRRLGVQLPDEIKK